MLFYSKFRTEISCHIRKEFSEQTEHNQISTDFPSSHSHINFSFSETPTFKHFRACVVLRLPCHFQHFYASAKRSISVACCNKFSSFYHLNQTTLMFFSFFPPYHSFLLLCSKSNFYLALCYYAALALTSPGVLIYAFPVQQEVESK